MVVAVYHPRGLGWAYRAWRRTAEATALVARFIAFVYYAFRYAPQALWRYRSRTISTVTDLAWGRGAVVVGGGTALVMVILGAAAGATVAVVAFNTLNMLGMGSITGVVSSFAITREFAPILAALGFAIQAGCRMTAEIGAMRISEEIDALEVLGVRAISFVVTTRVIAGLIVTIPIFLITILVSYLSSSLLVGIQGESQGAYSHYFDQFVNFPDLAYATLKVVVFVVVIILIHTYQGFFASGGPEGVGVASGHAIRASLVAIVVLDMILTIAIWGFSSSLVFRG